MTTRSTQSPRLSLPDAISKSMVLLDKENDNPVAPDVFAHHLGYSNAKNGAFKTVYATLKMYGLVEKTPEGKVAISADFKKYKYSPNAHDKHEVVKSWLNKPALFRDILRNGTDNLPSEEGVIYELIQNYKFKEANAKSLYKILNDSIEFANGLAVGEISKDSSSESLTPHDVIDENQVEFVMVSDKKTQRNYNDDSLVMDDNYSIHIKGPGIDSLIDINSEDDLFIVEATLKKCAKISTQNKPKSNY